tara:strand:- start:105 stop:410 length:306 start_codon:yes stop_codon:yes gene_type:complete
MARYQPLDYATWNPKAFRFVDHEILKTMQYGDDWDNTPKKAGWVAAIGIVLLGVIIWNSDEVQKSENSGKRASTVYSDTQKEKYLRTLEGAAKDHYDRNSR